MAKGPTGKRVWMSFEDAERERKAQALARLGGGRTGKGPLGPKGINLPGPLYKTKTPKERAGKGAVAAAYQRKRHAAFGKMPGTGYVYGPGPGKKKKKKSRLSRMYSAVDRKVFRGALPGGAKRKQELDKLVADTSAASKSRSGAGRRRSVHGR